MATGSRAQAFVSRYVIETEHEQAADLWPDPYTEAVGHTDQAFICIIESRTVAIAGLRPDPRGLVIQRGKVYGGRVSNPRPPDPQSGALTN